ncbi:mitochondrial carrier domain-containing protein [Mortierella sp. GBAus27b]|nr:mitochondrial thiamine pyrophosphate transporter [Mortierella sp. GBA43]KAI8358840.1 mitochondrial carrier domain-containing protein [Mortierella sp. GBAus27b]
MDARAKHAVATTAQDTATKDTTTSKKTGVTAGTLTLSMKETVFCGAVAGVVSRFVIAPLDVVKIRLQMQTQRKDFSTVIMRKKGSIGAEIKQQPKYRGMFSAMGTIVREEGVRGLWKGNMAAEYLYLTYSGIQFLVYRQTKVFLTKTAQLSAQKATAAKSSATAAGVVVATPLHGWSAFAGSSAVQSFIAGANAGIVATACTYPFDLLRTRFAVQRDVYTGVLQACRHIYRADGIPGFYRGMAPSLIQVIPYMGIMFGSYDTLKRIASWLKDKDNVEPPYSKHSDQKPSVKTAGQFLLGLEDMICGALSGVISKTGVYPLDMVRKRLQIQGSEQQKAITGAYSSATPSKMEKLPTNAWKCMTYIARTEGFLALYKGLLPGLIKAAPASAVIFVVFSQAGALVEKFRGPSPTAVTDSQHQNN